MKATVLLGAELHPAISVGTPRRGAQLFAHRMEATETLYVLNREASWALPELISAVEDAAHLVRRKHPGGERLVVGDASRRNGGRFRPHYTHQGGRDVDMRYYLHGGEIGNFEYRPVTASNFDLARNWALLQALMGSKHVDRILMDYRHQRRVWTYARSLGVTKTALQEVLSYPRGRSIKGALIHHARGHWNHLHVRVRGAQARRLGRPWTVRDIARMQRRYDRFLGRVGQHLVTSGDSFSGIAKRYNISLETLQSLNRNLYAKPLQPGVVVRLRVTD